MDKKLEELRSKSKNMPANITIGKNGITDAALSTITGELFKNNLVKIKILPSYLSDKTKEEVFEELIEKTGSKTVSKIGFTITLTRK